MRAWLQLALAAAPAAGANRATTMAQDDLLQLPQQL
jgi:hypothetical protein